MLYIVDGTGDPDQKIYRRDMSGGFCDRMSRLFKGHYYRGPSLAGTETYEIADHLYAEIKRNPLLGKEPLFLAGHSRGGAAVIRVAQRLKKDGRLVEALFLFDAVDRTASLERVQYVPRNVKVTYHARRDTSIATYFEWGAINAVREFTECVSSWPGQNNPSLCEGKRTTAIKYRRLDDAMKVRMRASYIYSLNDGYGIDFGNCGVGLEPDGANVMAARYDEGKFLGSHGAIGGSPIGEQDGAWRSEADKHLFLSIRDHDRAAMASVWAWMSTRFEEQKLVLHQGTQCTSP